MDPVPHRLLAQGLAGAPATAPVPVVHRLLAVQAQDFRAARLAIRSRSTGLAAADVDAALDARALVVSWLNRGTLHLVEAADWAWLHALTTPQLATGNRRRLEQEGVDAQQAARGVAVVADAVAERPRTRDELRGLLDGAGVPTARQALVHVLFAACLEGRLIRGPVVGAEQGFVDPAAWLGPTAAIERDEALARLARRYLVGHAPADARDLATWAGITLGDARRALAAVAAETEPWGEGLVRLAGAADPAPAPPAPRLLGGFDPLLHGWASREPLALPPGAVTDNGIFRPTALVGGRIVGTWTMPGGVPTLAPFRRIGRRDVAALDRDARDVCRYLGLRERGLAAPASP